ncbi:NAD-dependent epimerase/dehydratase family protein [Rhizobium sp. AQ_MP]|jgi:nucleoside-diphosphate-sugar epimerase|uniref:NAD-dependent epimerase/dehydratase family protein n=1 Tax=Rhizobium sp. AQ_MP TaxID=2761536 RepID=UPI001639FE82|nr:NAD-dependent epimerase/dehydratase family protein [Rhizobium sp. AQ_MP]MBC2774684.1 NAD-dependent epimerase/dehydratase family protein [Rhizobium sp. AQ_MP]
MPVALVSGANGFLGRYVCRELSARGTQVLSLSRKNMSDRPNVLTLLDRPTTQQIRRIIDDTEPQIIFHIAGTSQSSDLSALYQANVFLAYHILEAVRSAHAATRVVLIGSAAEYGPPGDAEGIVRETDPCRPVSPYGISKLAQTLHGLSAVGTGVDVTIARLFNPIGAGSGTGNALGSFVHQIAAMPPEGGILRTGALDSVRDFIAVEEAARVIVELAGHQAARGHVFNICTGIGSKLQDLVDLLIAEAGIPVTHQIDALRRGTSGLDRVVGSNEKLLLAGIRVSPTDYGSVIRDMLHHERAKQEKPRP